MAPTMPNPMVISPMVMNLIISKHVSYTVYLGNIHNKNILGEYYTCHLFCLALQFCEALKHGSICSKGSLLVIYLKGIG